MIDRVEIRVKGGDGGNGAISFRREKYVPFGGPDGGDGGNGGSVLVVADGKVRTFRSLRKRFFAAQRGGHGSGKKQHGRRGENLLIAVPPGTVIHRKNEGSEVFLIDLDSDGARVVVARGGMGGWGNAHFITSTNQAPRFAQRGEKGEEISLILDLKLIADVGIVGYPNVGKSTLLCCSSRARPKVADYPFTTLEPALGVVEVGWDSFVMADIPGLIEGAHRGVGLGGDFLRHVERTRVLIHLVDGTSSSLQRDIKAINEELILYSPLLAQKPQILAVNKIDLPEVRAKIGELETELLPNRPFFISAATGEGVPRLMEEAFRVVQSIPAEKKQPSKVVFRPLPKEITVLKDGDAFLVSHPGVERMLAMTDLENLEARAYIKRRLARLGVARALERAGVRAGDRVRFGDIEMEWD